MSVVVAKRGPTVRAGFVLLLVLALVSPALFDAAVADEGGGFDALIGDGLKAVYFAGTAMIGASALRRAG